MANDQKNNTVGERMAEARKRRASEFVVSSIGGAEKPANTNPESTLSGIAARRRSRGEASDTPFSDQDDAGVSVSAAKKGITRARKSKAAPTKKEQPRTSKKKTYYASKGARKKAHRKRHTVALIVLILILLIAGAFTAFYFLAKVENITVEGNSRFTEQQIINFSGLYTGRNILLYDLAEARDNIEKNPYIDCLGVSRKLPDEIHIKVSEREEFAAIAASGGNYCVISRDGFVLDVSKRDDLDGLIPVYGLGSMGFTTGTSIAADGSRLRPYTLMQIFESLGERSSRIRSIDISNSASVVIETNEGVRVMLGDSIEIPKKIEYMFRAIEKADAARLDGTVIYVNSNGTADIAYPSPSDAPSDTEEPIDTEAPVNSELPEDSELPGDADGDGEAPADTDGTEGGE